MSNLDKMLPSSTALFLCANLSLIKTQTLCKQKPSLQLLLQSSFSSLSVKEKPTKEIFLSLQCIRAFIKKQRCKSHHLNSISTAVNTLSECLVYSELAHSLPSAFTPHVDICMLCGYRDMVCYIHVPAWHVFSRDFQLRCFSGTSF